LLSRTDTDTPLIQKLPTGPIDIIGDVHGEAEALNALLAHLGYTATGHPQGRSLAFVGDLVDRGPDSPAVVRKVQSLMQAGVAQCILGNHEMNILRGLTKQGNAWIFGKTESLDNTSTIHPQVAVNLTEREEMVNFFKKLPVALEREDLRVVHACWDNSCVELIRNDPFSLETFERHMIRIDREIESHPAMDNIDRGLRRQNHNPLKVLTSGPEQRAPRPFEANGKIRKQERKRWWMDYKAQPFCVFGHYWRTMVPGLPTGNQLFEDHMAEQALGPGFSMCIDYSVGGRWRERTNPDFQGKYVTRLAALRWPEKLLLYEDGSSFQVGNIQV
jgi:hypothetical protein